MKRKKAFNIFLSSIPWFIIGIIFLLQPGYPAEKCRKPPEAFSFAGNKDYDDIRTSYSVELDAGSHALGIGVNFFSLYSWEVDKFLMKRKTDLSQRRLNLSVNASFKQYASGLGIRGSRTVGRFMPSLGYSWGKVQNCFSFGPYFADIASHNFSYYYIAYRATDGTSQFSGGLSYSYVQGYNLFRLQYENDWNSFLFANQYRTAGAEVLYMRKLKKHICGTSFGFKLWTGETEGFPTSEDKQFPDPDQHGSDFSHGILYGSFIWDNMRVEMGWDSEKIRDVIQNRYLRFRNMGEILPLKYKADRIYIQCRMNAFGSLY
ncbi:MAG: hypothetical protein HQK83_18375 [Fibrobacteria bacterium]|nr:hypothetical protein [Fibrobacteria bacterium]